MINHDENNPLPGEPPQPAEVLSASEERAIPEDICVPWDWLDIVLFVLIGVGGTFLLGTLVVMGLGLIGITPAQLQKSPSTWSVIGVAGQIFLDLALLAYLAIQMRVRFQSPFWRTIGWRPLESEELPVPFAYLGLIFSGLALSLFVSWADTFFIPKRPLPIQTVLQDQHASILFMLTAVLLAPLVEETIFRGYLYPVVARSIGIVPGILVTGITFGLLHSRQLWGGWWQIFLIVFVGIVLTFIRAVTRTVWASYVVHASYNSLQVVAIFIVAVSRYFHRVH